MARRGAKSTVPALEGPWASAWQILASPWTLWTLALMAAVVVIHTLAAGGDPPVGEALLQVPLALLPFAVAAHALEQPTAKLASLLWSAGLLLAGWGALNAGLDAGTLDLGAPLIESYQRQTGEVVVPVHLGGALTSQTTPEGLALQLGIQSQTLGATVLPEDPAAEADLGPWAVHIKQRGLPSAPTAARLRFTHRANKTVVDRVVPEGTSVTLEDGTNCAVNALSADFGRALGGAAQITLRWNLNSSSAWIFEAAPELDARLSKAPWIVTLREVIAAPQTTLSVRRRGPIWAALAGLVAMLLGALLGLITPKEAQP